MAKTPSKSKKREELSNKAEQRPVVQLPSMGDYTSQISATIDSFNQTMTVASTAIIGGPQHVGKDLSTLQSNAKNKDSLYGIIYTQGNITQSINETLSNVSENIETITNNLDPITSSWEDFVHSVDEIRDQIVNPEKNTKGSDKVQLIQLAAGDANVGELLKSLQDFDEKSLEVIEKIVTELNKLNSVDLSKFKENIQVLDDDVIQNTASKLDKIKDLYEKNVAAAAVAAEKGQQDLEKINEANKKVEETIVEGKKPDEKQLKEAKNSYEGLAATVMAGAFAMIVGALIIKAFPEFPDLAIKFTVLFTLFLTAVMVPLVLSQIILSKYGGDKGTEALEEIAGLIAVCAFVMIIGALFMKIPGLAESALAFSKQLALFFILTIGALALVTWFVNPELMKSVEKLGNLIIISTFVMLIGALFMQIEWLPKNALLFGLTLGLFIATILVPFILMSWIGGNKKFIDNIKGVNNLIVACTIVMMVGALFMLLDNGTFVKNALLFGVVLSLFIALVILPFILLRPLIGIAEKVIKDMTRFVLVCTIVMLVGALFVLLGKGTFVKAALKFTAILSLFMVACILPTLLLKPFIMTGLQMLKSLSLFVLISASVLFVGAYFIRKGYALDALAFTGVFTLYLIAVSAMFALLGLVAPLVGPGALVGLAIGVALMALAGGFALISIIAEKYKDTLEENLTTIGGWIWEVGKVFAKLGLIAIFVALGSVAIIPMSIALIALSGALALVSYIVQKHPTLSNDIDVVTLCIGKIGLLFTAIGLLSPLIVIGSVVIALMTPVLAALSGVLILMTIAAKQVVEMPDTSNIGDKIKNFFAILNHFPGPLEIAKKTIKIAAVTPLALLLSTVLLTMSLAITAISNLRVIEEWDEHGKPKKYRNLKESDFTNASNNVSIILTTMADAIAKAKDKIEISEIKETLDAVMPLGEFINGMATGIQAYANLVVPTEWDENGKPIKFRPMIKSDFIAAKENIVAIMETAAEGLKAAYETLVKGDGCMKLDELGPFVEAIKPMGEIIANTVTGLQGYANLNVPTEWDENGKPIKFTKFGDTERKDVEKNIPLIISGLAKSILTASKEENVKTMLSRKGRNLLKDIKSMDENILALIGDLCTIVKNISELKIPTGFNKDGKVTGYTKIDSTEITKMQENVKTLLLAMPEVIVTTCIDGEHSNWFKTLIPNEEKNIVATINAAGNIIDAIMFNTKKLLEPDAMKAIKEIMAYKQQFKGTAKDVFMTSDLTPGLFIDYASIVMGFLDINRQFTCAVFKYIDTTEAIKTVSMETELLNAMAKDLTKLLVWAPTLIMSHKLEVPKLKYRNKYELPIFCAFVDLYSGFMLLNREFTGYGIVGFVEKYLDGTEAKQIAKVVNLIGWVSKHIAITSNKITDYVNSIKDVTMQKEKLAETVRNMKGVIALISNVFGGDLTKTETRTIFRFFGFTKTIEYQKRIDTKKIFENVNWLKEIIKTFTLTSKIAERINQNAFDNFILALGVVKEHTSSLDDKNITKFDKEVKATEKFIKTIDSVKVKNVLAVTKLLEQMSKLSEHIGDLDKFTKVLSEQLTTTLTELTKQIGSAQRTIKDADRIQRQRHELIDKSVAKVQKMMESTLQVNVTSTKNGAETTANVTEEQR